MNNSHMISIAGVLVLLSAPAEVAGAAASSPFDNAVAVWHMADLNDTAGKNSALTANGDVTCQVKLEGAERDASLRRGGDGCVARFDGGWLDAGQGAGGELNLTGNAMTTAMRVRDPSGKWGSPLFGKKDVGTRLAYSIVSGGQLAAATHWPEQPNVDGSNPVFLAEIGSDAVTGVHQVTTLVEPPGLTDWHDVVVRFDGKTLQLFVDGNLRDDEVAISALRTNKSVPCLIGAEPCEVAGMVNGGMEANTPGVVKTPELRPEIVFDNFESGSYQQWTVEGEAFGKRPSKAGELVHNEPIKNREGNYLADSMLSLSDVPTGKLTSAPFAIPRRYIGFRIAGGNHAERTCMNLLVDGKVVRTATGDNSETLVAKMWDVGDLEGKQARLEIVDAESGGWGHVLLDLVVFTDQVGVKPATFHGLVDHVALWNRALSDAEIATISGVSQVGDKRPRYYGEKYRPQFHFSAQKYWLNDPNGLVYYEGIYHLFFQLWPPGRPPAYKEWGHAVSTDLVHWQQLPSAITPHEIWGGCWSGSAAVDWKNTTGLQTGKDKPIVAILTTGGKGPNIQSLAYSVDGAKTFQYYDKNPVLGHIVGLNRDPKVVWHAPTHQWIMALYLAGNDYLLLASPDMKTWEQICNLNLPGVTECPDLFPLAVDGDPTKTKWVFWGADGNYLVGAFDGRTFKQEGGMQKADYGNAFYAAQTWSDIPEADGRRIQIAWMGVGEYPGMPFNQQMSFPTELTLRNTPDGLRLYRMPVREITRLHQRERAWSNVVLQPGDNPFADLSGDTFDISAEFELGDAKVLGIKVRGEPVQYDVAAKTLSCRGRSAPLSPENGRFQLRILVDRTSVEVFGNDGRVVLTCCFLPPDDNKNLELYAVGGNAKVIAAKVYPLKSIWNQPAAENAHK